MALIKQTFIARYGISTSAGDASIAGAIAASGAVTSGGGGSFAGDGYFGGTGSVKVSVGTTAQRPATANAVAGMVRYNADTSSYEGYFGSTLGWGSLANTTVQALDKRNNLSDLTDVSAARANLNVYSIPQIDSQATAYALKSNTYTQSQLYTQTQVDALIYAALPAGFVIYYAGETIPTGFLKANGAAISRTAYARLFTAIGATYGGGNGSTTFNVPELRGEFIRGLDDGRGVDSSRLIGTFQADLFKTHNHTATSDVQGAHVHTASSDLQGSHTHAATTDVQGIHSHGGVTGAVGDHQHISPFGDQKITYPYGQVGSNNQVGSNGGVDNDNNWPYTSPAGGHNHTISLDGGHGHNITVSTVGAHYHNITVASAGSHSHNITVASTGGAETRPRNVALYALIKY